MDMAHATCMPTLISSDSIRTFGPLIRTLHSQTAHSDVDELTAFTTAAKEWASLSALLLRADAEARATRVANGHEADASSSNGMGAKLEGNAPTKSISVTTGTGTPFGGSSTTQSIMPEREAEFLMRRAMGAGHRGVVEKKMSIVTEEDGGESTEAEAETKQEESEDDDEEKEFVTLDADGNLAVQKVPSYQALAVKARASLAATHSMATLIEVFACMQNANGVVVTSTRLSHRKGYSLI